MFGDRGVHWIVVEVKFERSVSVKVSESAKVNQTYLEFIPNNKCPGLEISEYEIRCHVLEEEKGRGKSKGA